MNILIVDDNRNNRMILRLLLEDYMEDNSGVVFSMDEAVDGLEAIKMCSDKEYSIVFMDIMMPNMDGIEATKIIRQSHKKVLIIAVSAVDDAQRQKQILSNGAEDYISKPVNADIFNTRIANYVTLIHSRELEGEKSRSNENGMNLFTKEIFSRYTNFILSSEDALSELWEYYLLESDAKCDHLSDVIRAVFSIAEIELKLSIKSNLFVEESEDYKYFTLTNIDKLPENMLELLLKKNEIKCRYRVENDKLSFELPKNIFVQSIEVPVEVEIPQSQTNTISETELDYASQALQVYDYIDAEDMADLEEYAGRLSSLMLIVGSGNVEEDEVVEIYTYIEKLGAILASYSEVYTISQSLSNLAADMATYSKEFIENSEALGPMCTAFSKDIEKWIEQSFHTGAPSVDFMNDTIAVNCQTISSMLKIDEASNDADDDFDDIFDF